jgi:N-methylhydantoinase A
LGIDVGGTFTDLVCWRDGQLHVHKVPSTPDDQSRGIVQGIQEIIGEELGAFAWQVVHGSTVATNALLERRGARTALITTHGFADVLEIGRQNRPQLYAFHQHRPAPLIPREWRFEVPERLDYTGKVLCTLDEDAVREAARLLREQQIESVAIVFLFSFVNATHEQRTAAILRELLPELKITLSCELLPEYREYERTSTVAINAYVRPPVQKYLERLANQLSADASQLLIMQSNGGTLDAQSAGSEAARLVLSGPAGGVVGAFETARRAMQTSTPYILTFDMGGTSTDVAILPGRIEQTGEGSIAGMPLRLPMIGIHTVGAGGGSIAWCDEANVLHVGPHSAGAVPGPICYRRGGSLPTVSDANLILGRLDGKYFLGGEDDFALDEGAARVAFDMLGRQLKLTPEAAALGVIRVANAAMEGALRHVSVERGHDPRQFVLLPFGGAGPLHACELAQSLGIQRILVPSSPGVLSALGMLAADQVRDASQALLITFENVSAVQQINGALTVLREQLPTTESTQWQATLDVRYRGQSYELAVPVRYPLDQSTLQEAQHQFHARHEERYGYARPNATVECVTVRLRSSVLAADFPVDIESSVVNSEPQPLFYKDVWFEGTQLKTACYNRTDFHYGQQFSGPALVFQFDCTTVIPPGWNARADALNNLWLEWN